MDDAIVVADDRAAEGDALDGAGDVGDFDDVAGTVLVFGEEEDAVDGVADEGLRAEREREAGDAEPVTIAVMLTPTS